jgi:hypothetical protein
MGNKRKSLNEKMKNVYVNISRRIDSITQEPSPE